MTIEHRKIKVLLIGGMEAVHMSFNHLQSVLLVCVPHLPVVNAIGVHLSSFKRRHELVKKFDPLILEDLEWTGIEQRFWEVVDIASGASESLGGRNLPRRARGGSTSILTYTRCNTSSTQDPIDEEGEDEYEDEDDYGISPEENTQGGDGEGDGDDFEMDDFDA
ncbi:hypothetical protein OROHE_017114 [Orobanche hederae]